MTQDAANRVDASGFPASDVLPCPVCASLSRMCLAVLDVYVMNPYALVYCAPEAPGGTKGTANSVMETPRDKSTAGAARGFHEECQILEQAGMRRGGSSGSTLEGEAGWRGRAEKSEGGQMPAGEGGRRRAEARRRTRVRAKARGWAQICGGVTSAPRRCEIPQAGLVLWK